MRSFRGLALLVSCLLLAAPLAADEPPAEAPSPWSLPEADSCHPRGGILRAAGSAPTDASSVPFETGDVFRLEHVDALRSYVPDFIWEFRDRFFHEGMRLEIGPCFHDYGAPAFYREATQRFRGSARLDAAGGLESYTAGLPFPPEDIAADEESAGLRFLWNVEMRYQAAGFRGRFRVMDLVGRIGRAEPFEGEMFLMKLAHRADRAASDYVAPGARSKQFVAGGLFFKPFDAREYAWRQFRDEESLRDAGRSDDLHAYLPQWRRVRRINANQVEGLYMPSFSVGVVQNQQLAVGGGAGTGMGGMGGMAAAGGAGGMGGSIQNKRSGYEGLEIRPLLYTAKVLGLHDVLTPIRSVTPGYPENPDRDFGPWGLSLASDRWDLRRALVLELRARQAVVANADQFSREILYVDLQTFQPLYAATFDTKGERSDVGMYAYRWSEDREDYPRWPDDESRPIRVLDSVAAAFANLSERGSWRRESWDNVGTPPTDRKVKRMISVNELTKRR